MLFLFISSPKWASEFFLALWMKILGVSTVNFIEDFGPSLGHNLPVQSTLQGTEELLKEEKIRIFINRKLLEGNNHHPWIFEGRKENSSVPSRLKTQPGAGGCEHQLRSLQHPWPWEGAHGAQGFGSEQLQQGLGAGQVSHFNLSMFGFSSVVCSWAQVCVCVLLGEGSHLMETLMKN